MKVYGNLMNRIAEDAKQAEPVLGEGATIYMYSDRLAGTVVEITDKYVKVREDRAIRIDNNGMSDSQEYRYEKFSEENQGYIWYFRKNKMGRWEQCRFNSKTGRWNAVKGGDGVQFGFRDKYHDFSF